MKDITFTLSGAPIWICDMRPGLTEDGVSIAMPSGRYRCRVSRGVGALASVEYLSVGRNPSREEKLGRFSIDMAKVGIVELAPLLASYCGDWTQLSDWSDEAAEERLTPWGGRLKTGTPHAVFFDIGGDCEVEVIRLLEGKVTVGFRLCPKEPEKSEARRRKWTWVEVKMRGLGDPITFCDDWEYEPDDDLVYDDIDSGISWQHETSKCPDVQLHKLCPRIMGVETIRVFTEESFGQEPRPRKKISLDIPKVPRFPTSRQLKEVVFRLFKEARKKAGSVPRQRR